MRFILILVAISLSSGCGSTRTVHDYEPVYIHQNVSDKSEFIEESIIQASLKRGWTPVNIEDGKIQASITVRGQHKITVLIEHDDAGFSISPVSTNMDNMFGRVHSKYNKWVNNLHRQITKRISQK